MKKQQSKVQAGCASSAGRKTVWKGMGFARCERKVRKLQIRIAKAQKARRYNKVKALQHLLVTPFETKVLTVRKVTTNKGKSMAGVDHVLLWDTDVKMNSSPLRLALYCSVALNSVPLLEIIPSTNTCPPSSSVCISSGVSLTP